MDLRILYEPLLFILLVSPLLLLGRKTPEWKTLYLFLFVGYFVLDVFLTTAPIYIDQLSFLPLSMNWEGKLLSYLGVVVFFFFFKEKSPIDAGLSFQIAPDARRYGRNNVLIFTVLVIVYGVLIGGYTYSLENVFFQLLMPSVVEEIVYRGILIMLLNEALTK
ncbi:MAG: hypothetical protein AAGJ93_12430, partial [Bacteroidota bacterium]